MSLLRAFGGRYFAILPRFATDEQSRHRDTELAAVPKRHARTEMGLLNALNSRCSKAYTSWRKRVESSKSVISSILPSQLALITQTAHCNDQSGIPEQPPAVSAYDLLVFENLAREFKNVITQDNYDGFRLEADRTITDNIQWSHTLFLGTILRDVGYLYQTGINYSSSDNNYLAMVKLGLDGMLTARGIAKLGKDLEFKANASTFLKYDTRNAYEAGFDYMGPGWTATLKTAWQGTWILNAAYTHQILPCLTLGSELTYIVANGSSIGTIAARYVAGDHILTVHWSKQPNFKTMDFTMQETDCARVQYVRRVNDRLSLATELEVIPATEESALRMGWEYIFRHARVQGSIDSSGRVAMQAQDYSGFGISGCMDYWNNIYRFGFMMHLLPPPQEQKQPEQEVPM